jgi:hypothetical protein
MSHTSNVLIEFGARAASFVQTDQSTAAAAELEVAVREQNLLAARVDSLTQQAEKLYVACDECESMSSLCTLRIIGCLTNLTVSLWLELCGFETFYFVLHTYVRCVAWYGSCLMFSCVEFCC